MSRARSNIFGNHGAVCSLITAQEAGTDVVTTTLQETWSHLVPTDSNACLLYSTYLGGAEGSTQGSSIGFDHLGDTFVGGTTTTGLFPGVPAMTLNPSAGFLTKLHPKLMTMAYTTFLGADMYGIDVTDPVSTTGTYSASGATIYTVGDRYIPKSDTTQLSNLNGFVVTLLDTP